MINAENVTKHFEQFTALDHVTCNIEDGCIYGMVGSNGAGKSTFLRVLTGVYKANEGIVFYDGKNVYENPEVKEQIVYVADELYFL
ncbi:MAG: ATP-binding cassette domain-containing protein, partial [Lachnospira sp.]|nr:ATP-binding cassette domain-containing protein [Lachnospira sp.]